MANPKLDTFEGAVDAMFKFFADPAALYAGRTNFENFLEQGRATDVYGALLSAAQFADAFINLISCP